MCPDVFPTLAPTVLGSDPMDRGQTPAGRLPTYRQEREPLKGAVLELAREFGVCN